MSHSFNGFDGISHCDLSLVLVHMYIEIDAYDDHYFVFIFVYLFIAIRNAVMRIYR